MLPSSFVMSSTASLPSSVRGGRCGLTQEKLDAHLWVTDEGRCKALCEDGSKCGDPYAKHAAGQTPCDGWMLYVDSMYVSMDGYVYVCRSMDE